MTATLLRLLALVALFFSLLGCETRLHTPQVRQFLTRPDRTALLAEVPLSAVENPGQVDTLVIDTTKTFQTIAGFGYTLTGGSAMLLGKMSAAARQALLRELFLRSDSTLGISYLRLSLGASDLDERVFSYNDLPAGQTDLELKHFSLSYDTLWLIPVLKEILSLNPEIGLMASPWSAPVWMKTNGLAKGGSLQPRYYDVYARYLVKYVQAMDAQGIKIHTLTLQNEPENPHNTPSMLMTAEEQGVFIRDHLGPLFQREGITTQILLFDHNADHPEYPISILNDTITRKYVAGSAFHLYLGEVSALGQVHDAHPDKDLYFTEQWTSGSGDFGGDLRWHVKNLLIGAPANYARTVLEWNLAADPRFEPHTPDGGCTQCLGALTLAPGDSVVRNVSYYIIGHASRFVPPGSVRVQSTGVVGFPAIAYKTPAGEQVLLALNDEAEPRNILVISGNTRFTIRLSPGEVATYQWK